MLSLFTCSPTVTEMHEGCYYYVRMPDFDAYVHARYDGPRVDGLSAETTYVFYISALNCTITGKLSDVMRYGSNAITVYPENVPENIGLINTCLVHPRPKESYPVFTFITNPFAHKTSSDGKSLYYDSALSNPEPKDEFEMMVFDPKNTIPSAELRDYLADFIHEHYCEEMLPEGIVNIPLVKDKYYFVRTENDPGLYVYARFLYSDFVKNLYHFDVDNKYINRFSISTLEPARILPFVAPITKSTRLPVMAHYLYLKPENGLYDHDLCPLPVHIIRERGCRHTQYQPMAFAGTRMEYSVVFYTPGAQATDDRTMRAHCRSMGVWLEAHTTDAVRAPVMCSRHDHGYLPVRGRNGVPTDAVFGISPSRSSSAPSASAPTPASSLPASGGDYGALSTILQRAYDRAARGKGAERHADGRPFLEQPIFTITDALGGSASPLLFQAVKKLYESRRLTPGHAENELLDAIVYIAAAVLQEQKTRPQP